MLQDGGSATVGGQKNSAIKKFVKALAALLNAR